RRLLGNSFAPRGFFPPELCYSQDIVAPIQQTGHQWIILSGVACPVAWPISTIYEIEFQGKRLAVLFRDDIVSNKISFRSMTGAEFLDHLRLEYLLGLAGQRDTYIITAMDGETFGHHIKNWEREFLAKVYQELEPGKQPGIKMVTLSELVDIFPRGQTIQPKLSSWSTSKEDIEAGNSYPLWRDPNNQIHQLQWKYLGVCLEVTKQALIWADNTTSKDHAAIAREFMDRALHSDQFWWANSKPRWDINLVHKGLLFGDEAILNAYHAITTSSINQEEKREYYYRLAAARELKQRIIDQLLGIFN
ncbi:MAG: hypothetical protein Q8Q41_04310, partial [bacterium]|nr:hypothetical protein [bacterium]